VSIIKSIKLGISEAFIKFFELINMCIIVRYINIYSKTLIIA